MQTTSWNVLSRVFLVAGILLAANASAQVRAPVPEGPALDAAQKAARELYGRRFAQAKSSAEKTTVAKEMLEAGETLPKGSADQYVVWKIARDVATAAGDVATALDTADKLAERFDVPAAKTKAETLLAARRQVTRSTQHKALAEAAVKVLQALIEAEDYETAASLVDAARASAQTAREYLLVKAITARADEIKSQQKASQGYRDALAVLQDKPADPAANLAAGSYLCFVKGDWEQGVPMLALGSDAPLQAVAAKDLKGAESAEAQLALGDEWWVLAEARKGREQESLTLRAGFWYGQAEPRLAAGLTRVKVQQRLADIAKLGQPIPAAKDRPASAPRDDAAGKEQKTDSEWILITWPGPAGPQSTLWLLAPDGKSCLRLTNEPGATDFEPKFSPDGRQIVFSRRTGSKHPTIWICGCDGSNPRELVTLSDDKEGFRSPVWRSNSQILYTRWGQYSVQGANQEIWQVGINDKPRMLFPVGAMKQGYCYITDLSPDRRQMVVAAEGGGWGPSMDIYLADLQGKILCQIWEDSPRDWMDGRPLWSHDGKRIAWRHTFTKGAYQNPEYYGVGLARLRRNEEWIAELQPDHAAFVTPLAWSPHGQELLCARIRENRSATLFIMNDRFQALRTICELDTWDVEESGSRPGRMADWAILPRELRLEQKATNLQVSPTRPLP